MRFDASGVLASIVRTTILRAVARDVPTVDVTQPKNATRLDESGLVYETAVRSDVRRSERLRTYSTIGNAKQSPTVRFKTT